MHSANSMGFSGFSIVSLLLRLSHLALFQHATWVESSDNSDINILIHKIANDIILNRPIAEMSL